MAADLDEHYAALRRTGGITVRYDEASRVVAAMRRRAAADGLRISASKVGGYRNLTPNQRRTNATTINLTRDGITIVAPDAPE